VPKRNKPTLNSMLDRPVRIKPVDQGRPAGCEEVILYYRPGFSPNPESDVFKRLVGRPGQKRDDIFREFLAKCRSSNLPEMRDLSGLDLCGLSFNGEDLRGFKFNKSLISGCDFDTSKIDDAEFIEAIAEPFAAPGDKSKRPTTFRGATTEGGTKMCGIRIISGDLSGLKSFGLSLRGAVLDNCAGFRADLTNSIQTHTRQTNCRWQDSKQRNVDRGNSVNLKNNYTNADMDDDLKDQARGALPQDVGFLPGQVFPDKCRDAIFIGNIFDESVANGRNSMIKQRMRSDRLINAVCMVPAVAAMAVGIGIVDVAFDMLPLDSIKDMASGWGQTIVTAVSLAVAKNSVMDWLIAPVAERLKAGLQKSSLALQTSRINRPSDWINRAKLTMVSGRKHGMAPILRALKATSEKHRKNPLFQLARFITQEDSRIVICDQKHLAAALAHISSNRKRGYQLPRDVTLVRVDPDQQGMAGIPSTVTFRKDGKTLLTWGNGTETEVAALYDEEGNPICQFDLTGPVARCLPNEERPLQAIPDLLTTLDNYERAILKDNGLEKFRYDKQKSFIAAGQDGSIIVQSIRTHDLHNTQGPAVIRFIEPEDNKAPRDENGNRPLWPQQIHFISGKYYSDEKFKKIVRDPDTQHTKTLTFKSGCFQSLESSAMAKILSKVIATQEADRREERRAEKERLENLGFIFE
jgi:uncharacterized protein YjbI with pentapeptide repeats